MGGALAKKPNFSLKAIWKYKCLTKHNSLIVALQRLFANAMLYAVLLKSIIKCQNLKQFTKDFGITHSIKTAQKKEAKILGEFEIVETLREDSYTSQKIGILKDTDRVFIISEFEVMGFGGGSRFEVMECKSLQCRTA